MAKEVARAVATRDWALVQQRGWTLPRSPSDFERVLDEYPAVFSAPPIGANDDEMFIEQFGNQYTWLVVHRLWAVEDGWTDLAVYLYVTIYDRRLNVEIYDIRVP